jgi:uncharacterized metal-binding protein YceD (DUF177 family)
VPSPFVWPLGALRKKVSLIFTSDLQNEKTSAEPDLDVVPIGLDVFRDPWFDDYLKQHELLHYCSTQTKEGSLSLLIEMVPEGGVVRVRISGKQNPLCECVRSATLFRAQRLIQEEAFFVETFPRPVGENAVLPPETYYEWEDGKIDLKEYILDALYDSLPDPVLCREDCKGLCSQCGANLNEIGRCPNASEPCENFQSLN